ncbi:nucleoporin GLE1 [Marchantia polymorpha subsp. ruderalis]|uniref:mRNA export factor GLE1 n=2 Tax=Marchantia polymorpha TaxID=3197 RepID=A0AAF6B0N1_MARPO|nr:hypothetical protein MARPO_0004s0250 [Marchantia polymorpha]BBN05565.1 hypothetical protein Mp_3g14210 [Marchantia polymorpha subsp. ruderalis]|eukprot:PTQ49017.1 hypothetical protein MARPO_0004s0250 [Marchantia polymorpha]
MMGTRLILTPKVPSPFGTVKWAPGALSRLDPDPDWGLEDLTKELDDISSKLPAAGLPHNTSTPLRPTDVSWRNLSKVADFGRKSKSFVMKAFDSSDDSDSSDDEETISTPLPLKSEVVQQKDPSPSRESNADRSPLLPQTERIEAALLELERERILRVQEEIRTRVSSLDDLLREEKDRITAKFSQLEKEVAAKCEMARRNDKQDQRLIAEARDMHLSALQRDHEQRYQVEEKRIRKEAAAAEEARRREFARLKEQQERAQAEAEEKARRLAEEEKKKAAAEAANRKAQADAAAAAALQRAQQETKAKQEAEQKAQIRSNQEAARVKASSVPKPRVADNAAKLEEQRLNKLMELQDSYKSLANDPALQKELKVYERKIIKHLQQVSATQEQVRRKSAELIQTMKDPRGPPIQFMMVTLGKKILSQCESQVQKLPSFSFALAQVVVNVASQIPFVMESVLAQLHQVCVFTVPKYYVFNKTQYQSDEAYYKIMGYKEEDGKLESTDDYVARMNAYIAFYAALTQTEVLGGGINPHGMAEAWAWCSRLLNRIPANRYSASALESFLKIAGFRIYKAYPKPFMKLMQVVVSEYLVSLKSHDDVDARAVVNRLETYLHTQQYMVEPEGRNMPYTDISSTLRA